MDIHAMLDTVVKLGVKNKVSEQASFPTIARYGRAYNLILPKKVQSADVSPWRDLFGSALAPALDVAAEAGLLYVIDLRIYETKRGLPHLCANRTFSRNSLPRWGPRPIPAGRTTEALSQERDALLMGCWPC